MPKSVVYGGLTYLSWMDCASTRMARARASVARPVASTSAHVGGVLDAHVVLLRQLGVDGQPDAAAGLVLGTRQLDGVLHHLARARLDVHVALELAGREDLLEQRAQLDLGPGAARLDVGEHALEVADAGGQGLHLPQPLLHRLELVADELERLAEALLERGLELLVDGGAHLLELLLVARLQLDDARVDGGADAVERASGWTCSAPPAAWRRRPAARAARRPCCRASWPASRCPTARPRASSSRDARDERSASSRAARSSARTASARPCAPAPERTSTTTSSAALATASSRTSQSTTSVMRTLPSREVGVGRGEAQYYCAKAVGRKTSKANRRRSPESAILS